MSKSVLVIDTPESCVLCPLSYYSERCEEHQCRGLDDYKTIENWYSQCVNEEDPRPDWCPLSPLPPHKDLTEYINNANYAINSMLAYQYAQGWNSCREEVLKGDKNVN